MDSRRLKRFVAGVARGLSDLQSARRAGYSESIAKNTRSHLWNQPNAHALYRLALQRARRNLPFDDVEPQQRQEPDAVRVWWTCLWRDRTRGLVRIQKTPWVNPRQFKRLEVVHILPGDREREMHIRFHGQRLRGNWFREEGALAQFMIDPETEWDSIRCTRQKDVERSNPRNGIPDDPAARPLAVRPVQ